MWGVSPQPPPCSVACAVAASLLSVGCALCRLRAAVASALLRARATVSEAHGRAEDQLGRWCTDAASQRQESRRQAGRLDDSMCDTQALKSGVRAFHTEFRALLATLVYRAKKFARRTRGRAPAEVQLEGGDWKAAAENFGTSFSGVLDAFGQEMEILHAELDRAVEDNLTCPKTGPDGQLLVSQGAAPEDDGSGAAMVRFRGGLVDLYHAAHKLSSRALLCHGTVRSKPALAQDLPALKATSTTLASVRADLKSCASILDTSELALAELIQRREPNDPVPQTPEGTTDAGKTATGEEAVLEFEPLPPAGPDAEVFECELAVLSSEAKHAAPLTAEEQRAQRKARMAARQRERQERLKELEAAERRAATARQFYEELKAVVKEQNDH